MPKESIPENPGQPENTIKFDEAHELFLERLKNKEEYADKAGASFKRQKTNTEVPAETISEDEKSGEISTEHFEDLLSSIEKGHIAQLKISQELPKTKLETGALRGLRQAIEKAYKKAEPFNFKGSKEGMRSAKENVEAAKAKSPEGIFEKVSAELSAIEQAKEMALRKEYFLAKRQRGGFSEKDRGEFSKIVELQKAFEKRLEVVRTNPETAIAARAFELKKYQSGLAEGFAETPSREYLMRWCQDKWEEGRAVFLEGPTGTGKTELLIHLAKKLDGVASEVIRTSERTGPSDIFGKILLKSSEKGGTETYFQPGRYVRSIEQGKKLIFDEFNNLPTPMRLSMKELYNRRAGDKITIQENGGKEYTIKEGFGFSATANVKSEKHKERFELDPAETRVFDMKRVDYVPVHELYDLALASLLDKKGNLPLSSKEATDVLKNFCDAVEMAEGAYEGRQSVFYKKGAGAKKEYAALEKAALDPGKALSIVKSFSLKNLKGERFVEHLNDEITEFVNKGDFPEEDCELLLKIFISKGFLKGREPKDFRLVGLDKKNLGIPWADKKEVFQKGRMSLLETSRLDPYNLRVKALEKLGEEFLKGVPEIKSETGRSSKEMPEKIRADFKSPDGTKETIEVSFDEAMKRWGDFYKENKVDVPSDFEKTAKAIWNQNYEKIQESVEKLGYDSVLLIPGNLDLVDFHQKMSVGYKKTYQSDNFKQSGSFGGIKSQNADKVRMLLYHWKDAGDLRENQIFAPLYGKNLMDISGLSETEIGEAIDSGKPIKGFVEYAGDKISFDGMTVEDYLAIQREYHKRTLKHLDDKTYSWLIGSVSGARRVPGLTWGPGVGGLDADADDPGNRDGNLAPRPAAVFTLGIGNENFSDFDFDISGEFENPESGRKEKISIDFEKELEGWQKFYEERSVDVPEDFAENALDVIYRNRAEMKKAIEEMGYDRAIIVPANLNAAELHQKMTAGFNPTYEYDSFKDSGGFGKITTPDEDRVRVILVHEKEARNNADHPILKKLRGKSVADVAQISEDRVREMLDKGEKIPMKITIKKKTYAFSGLDVHGYLIWQREYADREKKHIDEVGWSSLPGSSIGTSGARRVPVLYWHPGVGGLDANAYDHGYRVGDLAPRPAAVFI